MEETIVLRGNGCEQKGEDRAPNWWYCTLKSQFVKFSVGPRCHFPLQPLITGDKVLIY